MHMHRSITVHANTSQRSLHFIRHRDRWQRCRKGRTGGHASETGVDETCNRGVKIGPFITVKVGGGPLTFVVVRFGTDLDLGLHA